jgi:tyrosyl-tRNA synthetase
MNYKKLLAYEIVLQFHTKNDADLSEKNFKESVQEKNVKFEKIEFQINELNSKEKLSKMLFNKNIITSTSEFKRLIKQNGVKLNGKILSEDISISKIKNGYQISLGKRKNIEINF